VQINSMPTGSVLCLGASGLDYLAYIDAFPKPDDKVGLADYPSTLRTESVLLGMHNRDSEVLLVILSGVCIAHRCARAVP
jgi:hypothetical protein